mmetsp:Transcript_14879/g.17604  ORF Transcript_14879/g.17604 Transcript_14879/m.17604 type:complete len:83 (-) Transcript_14879:125-373(-)
MPCVTWRLPRLSGRQTDVEISSTHVYIGKSLEKNRRRSYESSDSSLCSNNENETDGHSIGMNSTTPDDRKRYEATISRRQKR